MDEGFGKRTDNLVSTTDNSKLSGKKLKIVRHIFL